MDEQLKYQITGAVIWFVLIVWVVGDWYAHPVNFSPEDTYTQPKKPSTSIVQQPLKIDIPVKHLPKKPTPSHHGHPIPDTQTAIRNPQPAAHQQQPVRALTTMQSTQAQARKAEQLLHSGYLVKVAAYYAEAQAAKLTAVLKKQGYDARYKPFMTKKGMVYSVRVGPFASRAHAVRIKQKLDSAFNTDCIIEPISQTEKK